MGIGSNWVFTREWTIGMWEETWELNE